jgi:hypothetical protein
MHTASSKTLIYWVKPVLPTALHNIESLPVVGPNKLYAPVDSTLVFPGTLCVKKLRSALALTLRDYPHAAGRLSCDPKTQKWRIHLTNDGVPITVGSTNLSYPTDEWFHHNERHPDLLGSLSPFEHIGIDLALTMRFVIDRLPMSFSASEVGNEPWSQPLVRFKLTIWEKTGETSLSVSASHILGSCQISRLWIYSFDLESQATRRHICESYMRGQITTKITTQ